MSGWQFGQEIQSQFGTNHDDKVWVAQVSGLTQGIELGGLYKA